MCKAFELPKLSKKLILKWSGGKLEPKYCFQRQSLTKYLTLILLFVSNNTLQGKFNFFLSIVFLLVLTAFWFWQEDWGTDYHSVTVKIFTIIHNLLRSLVLTAKY